MATILFMLIHQVSMGLRFWVERFLIRLELGHLALKTATGF